MKGTIPMSKKAQSFIQWLNSNPPVQPYIFDTERLHDSMIAYLTQHPKAPPSLNSRVEVRALSVKLGYTDYTGGCLWGRFRKANA